MKNFISLHQRAKLILLALALSILFPSFLLSQTWDFAANPHNNDWTWMGKVTQVPEGLQIGPSVGPYAVSGLKSTRAIDVGARSKISVDFTNVAISNEAPDDLENENDIRINLLINSEPVGAWETSAAILNAALFINGRHNGIYAGLFAKNKNQQFQPTLPIGDGEFLGESSGTGEISFEVSIQEEKVSLTVLQNGQSLTRLEAPLPDYLKHLNKSPVHLLIYQQNIGDGSGSFILKKVAVNKL